MNIADERRRRIYEWCEEDKETRISQTELRKEVHLSYIRFAQIVQDWKAEKFYHQDKDKEAEHIRSIMQATLYGEDKIVQLAQKIKKDTKVVEDILSQPDEMKKRTIKALFDKTIEKADHNAAFRLAQIMGWIVEKSENKHIFELSADDYFQIREEARRELSRVSADAKGSRKMLPESTILPEDIREDTG